MALVRFLFFTLLITNVLLRVLTNYWNILPKIFNISDVFIVTGLVGLSFFVRQERKTINLGPLLITLAVFNVIAVVGTLLNYEYIYPLSALSQLVMWNEPILLFLAVINLPFTEKDIRKFKKLVLWLVGLQVAIGVIQISIYLQTSASESIIGTFSGNAEQYQIFVLIGVFYLLARVEGVRGGKGWSWTVVLLIMILLLLIDNKASWVALTLTLWYLLPRLSLTSTGLMRLVRVGLVLSVLVSIGYAVVKETSGTFSKFGKIYDAWNTENIGHLGKVKALGDVIEAYSENSGMLFIGSGLGTFYSRAAFQFFPFRKEIVDEGYEKEIVDEGYKKEFEKEPSDSASMEGVIKPVLDVEPFYRQFYRKQQIFIIGSGTADFPTSSYISLLGETGILGTILYLSFYVFMIRRLNASRKRLIGDKEMYPFLMATLGSGIYLMLIAGYNFWLDCGRVNTIQWSMVAMVLKYVHLKEMKSGEKITAEATLV